MIKLNNFIAFLFAFMCIVLLFFTGYITGKSTNPTIIVNNSLLQDELECALAQRDRLADYLHTYMDMQESGDTVPKLSELVETMEKEDNLDNKIPPMQSNRWCYAY